MSLVLAVKLFASPLLIGLASLAGKRWGPAAAGLMGGLPLVGGPVVLALWLAQGGTLATQVSLSAPVGVWATLVYLLMIGFVSARCSWYLTIAIGWCSYLSAAIVLQRAGLADSGVLSWAILPALWLAATRLLPRPLVAVTPAHLPRIELWARMATAVLLVLSLTTAADRLGPQMTGVLAGAPVAATVIPAFILANHGRDALLLALRGFLTGLLGFAVFFLVLGHGIPAVGAAALAPALLLAITVSLLATPLVRRATGAAPCVAPASDRF